MDVQFLKSVVEAGELPPQGVPEAAFMGRSNVGKSSLINALVGRRGLARASRTPGRTQMVNFFTIGSHAMFVDLPGYGFNVASNAVRRSWAPLMASYMGRTSLKALVVLIDSRRGLQSDDWDLLKSLPPEPQVFVGLTKCDKLSKAQVSTLMASCTASVVSAGLTRVQVFGLSTLHGSGVEDLRRSLFGVLGIPR